MKDLGMIVTGVDYKNPVVTIIFIWVDRTGDFLFCNSMNERYEFYTSRWKHLLPRLKPYRGYAVGVETYNTNTASGQGFKPLDIVAEFESLREAKAVNYAYLQGYMKTYDERGDLEGFVETFLQNLFLYEEDRALRAAEEEALITSAFTDFSLSSFLGPDVIEPKPETAYLVDGLDLEELGPTP
jgi:hypothetical protein